MGDEWGTPTYAADVADAIVELLGADALAGVHHLVNGEVATRATWAEDVLDRLGVGAAVEPVPGTTWERASVPPRWGVLAATPLPGGEPMRSWRAAMADYAPVLRRERERERTRRRPCNVGVASLTDLDRPRLDARRASATGRSPDSKTRAGPSARSGATTRSARSTRPTPARPPAREARFVQANLSTSAPGVLRGLHLHQRQLDHWVVASGRAFVALVDVRPMLGGESDRPLVETRELTADEWVDIPIGVAHGFLALEPLQLIYLVTNAYDGSDELGFAWDDPLAAVKWPAVHETPDGSPILSDRDRTNPSLTELVGRLRTTG